MSTLASGPFSRKNLKATLFAGYLPMLIAVLVMLVPLGWMILSSFKPRSEIVTTNLSILPHAATLSNYAQAASTVPIAQMFVNSLLVTAVGTLIKVVLALLSAYALVFVRFPFKKTIFLLVLVALMVPPSVALVPNFTFIAGLGGVNTYWGIIVPGLGTAFGTFLLRQQFLSIPHSLIEAAELDGASHLRRLFSVVVPVAAPSIATVALVTLVNEWNDYLWPLVVTTNSKFATLPVGLNMLQSADSSTNWGVLMAGATLVIIPVLIIFALLQRYIVAGLTQGSVTG